MMRLSLCVLALVGACSSAAPSGSANGSTQQASTAAAAHDCAGQACEHASHASNAAGTADQPMNASCEHHGNPNGAPAPTATSAGTLYGTALATGEITPLASILSAPQTFADRTVKTEGTISAVCQRRGCWMELRADSDSRVIRVPMAGHAFFLPRDVAGKHAVIEGRVIMQELSPEQRAHFESEGATATGAGFAIHATGVEVH